MTPGLLGRVVYAMAECRSAARATLMLKELGGHARSEKTVERVGLQVGQELVALRDQDSPLLSAIVETPPELAVVECDGGRIRTRQMNCGPGVHEPAWRETKNACLLRMTHKLHKDDPHPSLPRCFRNPKHVAALAEQAPLLPAETPSTCPNEPEVSERWQPEKLVRTVISSMVNSETFGSQMQREAQRRRFFEAAHRAFLGDGLPWNWSLWKQHFPRFTPILDFIHVLVYVHAAAAVLGQNSEHAWQCYLEMSELCWQGRVGEVIAALQRWLAGQKLEIDQLPEDDPRLPVATAVRYFTNNRSRMDYHRYRRAGLPITSSQIESTIKELNLRVKGSEMFWNDPHGAEAILQLRAAALCDDNRLSRYLKRRPGCPFVRRTSLATAA
jgi:hypothetical protein